MKPTRTTQPMRKGARHPSQALVNAMRGRDLSGHNPMDARRAAQRMVKVAKARAKRPARPKRPPRPAR